MSGIVKGGTGEAQSVRALVVTGDGINSERETARAFQMAGFQVEIRHINDLISEAFSGDQLSQRYQVLVFPGGYSFGDHLAAGKIFALKIQHGLKWNLAQYAERGGLVMGICNGFQSLIRMGVFGKDLSIMSNQSGRFVNQWVKVAPEGNRCVWLRGLGTLELPIRHSEGKIVIHAVNRQEVMAKLARFSSMCLRYEGAPTGSEERLAGMSDSTGRIFGLMPHPEAFVSWMTHPAWTQMPGRAGSPGQGLMIFENAFHEARRSR